MAEHDEHGPLTVEMIDRLLDVVGRDPEAMTHVGRMSLEALRRFLPEDDAALRMYEERVKARFLETAPLLDLIPWKREAGDG